MAGPIWVKLSGINKGIWENVLAKEFLDSSVSFVKDYEEGGKVAHR